MIITFGNWRLVPSIAAITWKLERRRDYGWEIFEGVFTDEQIERAFDVAAAVEVGEQRTIEELSFPDYVHLLSETWSKLRLQAVQSVREARLELEEMP